MLEPLDIFKMQKDGTYVWEASAATFDIATSKIEQLASIASGDYMIFKTIGKKTVIYVLSQWMLETAQISGGRILVTVLVDRVRESRRRAR